VHLRFYLSELSLRVAFLYRLYRLQSIEEACEEQIPRRLDIVFRFIGMVDLREKHAENMVVDHVLGDDFEAGLIDFVCLTAEDELLVIIRVLHGSLHRRDLGVSLRVERWHQPFQARQKQICSLKCLL